MRTKLLLSVGATAFALTGCILVNPQYGLTIHDLIESDRGTEHPVMGGARDETASLCGDQIRCVEAYDTDLATYYRFANSRLAVEFADTLPDGFRSNHIVMDFGGKEDASREEQQWAMERLVHLWQDFEGEIPARN